uniref:SMP-30/Gluconolactonase/LRE-like region domain-containing protein n=1 Tax=viral metagenome TaxID=1070528 RepID=A0A6C0D7K6_9ZZZZ
MVLPVITRPVGPIGPPTENITQFQSILIAKDEILRPLGITVAPDGTVYFVDFGNSMVRKLVPTGEENKYTMETVAGVGSAGYSGDGGLAINAKLYGPSSVVFVNDNLYIADTGNQAIRRVDADGIINTISMGDGGRTATSSPSGLTADIDGNLYVTDSLNNKIYKLINPSAQTAGGRRKKTTKRKGRNARKTRRHS